MMKITKNTPNPPPAASALRRLSRYRSLVDCVLIRGMPVFTTGGKESLEPPATGGLLATGGLSTTGGLRDTAGAAGSRGGILSRFLQCGQATTSPAVSAVLMSGASQWGQTIFMFRQPANQDSCHPECT